MMLRIPKSIRYPYIRREGKIIKNNNYINLIPPNLQGVYVQVAVTFDMRFFGDDQNK